MNYERFWVKGETVHLYNWQRTFWHPNTGKNTEYKINSNWQHENILPSQSCQSGGEVHSLKMLSFIYIENEVLEAWVMSYVISVSVFSELPPHLFL